LSYLSLFFGNKKALTICPGKFLDKKEPPGFAPKGT